MGTYHNTAIVFGNLKDALLYFEHVIPMNFPGMCTGYRPMNTGSTHVVKATKEQFMDAFHELNEAFGKPGELAKLFPPHLANVSQFERTRNAFEGFLVMYLLKTFEGPDKVEKYIQRLAKISQVNPPDDPNKLCPTIEGLQAVFSSIVNQYHLKDVPIDCSNFFLSNASNDNYDNCLLVPQIRVVDTSKTTLGQIMEFRKDRDAMNKMRNFRLFAYEQYNGKNKTFIEDDIQRRLAEYDEAVKTWGFNTTTNTLSFLFESKFLMGAFATSAVSLLMGNPSLAVEAFGAGTIVELGKLSLEYARSKSELKKICRENPISYISNAKQALES